MLTKCVGFLDFARRHLEERFVEHIFFETKMVHFLVERLDLEELFYGPVVSERIVRHSFDEHCENWIEEQGLRLQTFMHRMLWSFYR